MESEVVSLSYKLPPGVDETPLFERVPFDEYGHHLFFVYGIPVFRPVAFSVYGS